ncbi:hypothetical protein L873DRAFT_665403 [Choiromyces venosus 120613-1]|uniref:Uncharacterized protein n=1 Tax=Choiromyces venosus 120613-1 TaxID=1336337 RepID=A0A3N4IT36_9PEZI|nr:hypothetical protein L873DRAFT_665403 [Choiromyces venosus 120613-1]
MAVKLSMSGSKGSSSSSSSLRNHPSFQVFRHALPGRCARTTASASSDITPAAITTPPCTIASLDKSQESPPASSQLDAITLSPSISSPATTPAISPSSSSNPASTAATTPVSTRPSSALPPSPEDVIKLLLSTTIYVYDNLTKLIKASNISRKSNPQVSGNETVCDAKILRNTAHSSLTAPTATEGPSSASCQNGMTHDPLHIVNSHRAFAQAIKAEIATLNTALARFSRSSLSARMHSFFPPSSTSTTRYGKLKVKKAKKHKYARGEKDKVMIWTDIKDVVYQYDWLWAYSYSANVNNWQEVIWACSVVTGVYGAGGLEGVNARMRDYGIAHAGVVDEIYEANRVAGKKMEDARHAYARTLGNQQNWATATTTQGANKKCGVVPKLKFVKIDGILVQVDPRVVAAQEKDEEINGVLEDVGNREGKWEGKLRMPPGVVAVGMKVKILSKMIKGKEKVKKCKKNRCRMGKSNVGKTINEDMCEDEHEKAEKAMWG